MGRNSSGNRGGMQFGDSSYKGRIDGVESLVHIKDAQVYKATKSAISRYHSVLGVRERAVRLADLSKETAGVHLTVSGESKGVFLNKKIFNQSYKEVIKKTEKGYNSGWSTRTNKPIAHTVTHELAHATWNTDLKGVKQRAAGKEIIKTYRAWVKDKNKKGYGKYAHTNVNEWFAETVTRAVHGEADKYTRGIKDIVRRYKL